VFSADFDIRDEVSRKDFPHCRDTKMKLQSKTDLLLNMNTIVISVVEINRLYLHISRALDRIIPIQMLLKKMWL